MSHAAVRQKENSVLWWSRGGRDYSRDRIIRNAFRRLGWQITDFRPVVSEIGDVEAWLRRVGRPDLVWVPCFRQRDLAAASRWATRHRLPLVFDPLISAWDKQVHERKKFSPDSSRARRLLAWESRVFRRADAVVADTSCHAAFFQSTLGVASSKLTVVPVSAEEAFFTRQPLRNPGAMPRVLFYGSFINLQGPQFIAEAARCASDLHWTFIGTGPLLETCRRIAGDCSHVEFIPRVPYETLPARISEADVLMGVFGTSPKAGRVIPNKVYQSLACGRPVVTQSSDAYPHVVMTSKAEDSGLCLVESGHSQQIVNAVRSLSADENVLMRSAISARQTFERYFAEDRVRASLAELLDRVLSVSCYRRAA